MTAIKTYFDIQLKKHHLNRYSHSNTEARVTVEIQDYHCASAEDKIYICPTYYDARLEEHGCKFGKADSLSTPGGDCYINSYETPLQIFHAINFPRF